MPATAHVFPTIACAGVDIAVTSRDRAARELINVARGGLRHGIAVHLCNAYTLTLADRDPKLRAVLQAGGVNLPDGKSVEWAARLMPGRGTVRVAQVRGSDLFRDVVDLGQAVGLRHYLLGSTPDVLKALVSSLTAQFPRAEIVGTESPPFRPLSDEERRTQLLRIRESGAHMVWVGLGTPKQDYEVTRLAAELPAVFCAVGAAFDFVSNNKREAPRWVQRHGMEWAFRLATEPGRLWKRYLLGNGRFVWSVSRQVVQGRPG